MSAEAERGRDWRAATLAVCLWPIVQMTIFAPIQEATDPDYGKVPMVPSLVAVAVGLVVAAVVARRRTPVAVGAAWGILSASILLLAIPLVFGILRFINRIG
ncbi:hypothetical protein [Nocardia amamiensis]|uniref:hypothetical protein n=1 Tax=Nocardia amamiensis TaxID=404578 RepID=UPI0033E2E432